MSSGWEDIGADEAAERTAYLERAATVLRPLIDRSVEALELRPGAAVLDVGCGNGDVLGQLADLVGPNGRAVGIDRSSAMVEEARGRLGERAAVEVGDACDLPFDDGSFDVVRSERTLMHVPAIGDAVREMVRVARSGGRVVALEPDHRRLAVDADDVELVDRLIDRFTASINHPDAGLRIRSDIVRAGGVDVTDEVLPYVIQDRDVFGSIFDLEAARSILVEDGVDEARVEAFFADLDRRQAEGRFSAVAVAHLVIGRVP